MTGRHHNWHRRWVIDLAAGTATHDSGLCVLFVSGLTLPRPEIGSFAYAEGIGEWTGTPVGGDAALREWLKWHPNLRDPASINNRIGRLMGEAGRVWAHAKKAERES